MSTPMPAFPIDVFGHIIDLIAQRRPPQGKLIPASVACLKDLSLVCKPFAELSQRHLFRCIGSTGSKGAGVLEGVLWIVENAPHIRLYIQDLKIDFTEYEDGTIPDAALARAGGQLARFPNLQVLVLAYRESASTPPPQPAENIDPVVPLLHFLIDFYITQGTLRTLGIEDVPRVSMSTIATFMAGRFSRRLLCKGTSLSGLTQLFSTSRITALAVCDIPSLDLSVLSYLPELTSLELSGLNPTLDINCTMDSLSLNLRRLALGLREPGQATFVLNLYKERAATSGVTAFGRLDSLKFAFLDRSDVLAFNEILSDVPPLRSLWLVAENYTEPVFPMDMIDIDSYFQHPARLLTSLFIAHHVVPTTESNFRASLAGLHNFLSAMATRNILEHFIYEFTAEADRLSLPPSGPWHDIGDILAPVSNFPNLRRVDATLYFHVDPQTLTILQEEKTYHDNFYIRGALMDLGDRLGASLATWMLFFIKPEDS